MWWMAFFDIKSNVLDRLYLIVGLVNLIQLVIDFYIYFYVYI